MITRTLAQLRSQVSRFLDEPIAATGRHTTTNANTSINAAIRRYQLMLADNGITLLKRGTLTTTSSTADADGWPGNEVVALPTDMMLLKSLSIQHHNEWVPMVPFDEPERDDYESWIGNGTGLPTQYRVATDNANALVLRLMPASDAAYSIRCFYVPTPTELSDDADSHRFLEGTEEWVELEAALDMLGEDGAKERGQVQLWREKQQRAEKYILKFKNLGQGSGRKQDTRGLRKRAQWHSGALPRGVG
jgi:hypothetical protein